MGEEGPAPSGTPRTKPGGTTTTLKIGEALTAELSRVYAAYIQQVQETLQACLGQLTEQWQSAFQIYASEYTKQWQEAVRALAVEQTRGASGPERSVPDLDARLAASTKPLEALSKVLSSTLSATLERIAQELNKPTHGQRDTSAAGESGEAE